MFGSVMRCQPTSTIFKPLKSDAKKFHRIQAEFWKNKEILMACNPEKKQNPNLTS